jgi:pimeloyl-ACP methyl ester carboxylesterase
MGMVRYGSRPAATRVWWGTTCALVPTNPTGEIVVMLHGWPVTNTAAVWLDSRVREQRTGVDYPVDALLATGHTIIYPWLGRSWGTVASSEQALGDVGGMVSVLGLSGVTPHLVGGSMGGLNAITFSRLEEAETWPVILYLPAVSIGEIWDLGDDVLGSFDLRSSVESAWGVGRATVVAAAADVDPVQVDCSTLAGRTLVIAASNDEVVNYETVTDWCGQWDLPLITTTSGHYWLDDPAIVETDLLAHFHPRGAQP